MYVLRKNRSGTKDFNFCFCIIDKKKFSLLFYTLMRAEEGTNLEDLPRTEQAWKIKKNIVTEVISYDSKSSVFYDDRANVVVFRKTPFVAFELEFLNEEISKSFVKELGKRLEKAEQVTTLNATRNWYSGNTLGRSSKWTRSSSRAGRSNLSSTATKRKHNIRKNASKMEEFKVDENTDIMRLKPRKKKMGINKNRGHSVDELRTSLKDYLLQTDSILTDNRLAKADSRRNRPLSASTFRISGSSIFNKSRKRHLPFVASESFRTDNEFKINKTEEERQFLSKCLLDLNTLHGVFLRDFDEFAVEELITKSYKVTFDVGEDIVVLGQIWDEFYVINEGEVKVIERESNLLNEALNENDKELILTKGSSFGIMCLLNPELSNINAKAVTKTTLWALRKNTFESIRMSNIDRQEAKKELFLKKILNQVNINYHAEEAAHLKHYMDVKIMSEGEKYIPPSNDETIVLCFSGLVDIILEGELSHSLQENMVHGLRYLEEIHFKGSIPDMEFVANRKSIILLVEAQELRMLLNSLRFKQNSTRQQRLSEQIPTSGATTINKLIKIFAGLKYRGSSSRYGQSKETMLLSNSVMTIASRPQCLDLETPDYPPLIHEMDIENFKYVSLIGQGHFGAVYVTVFPFNGNDEIYVMKVVSREGSFDSVSKFNKLNREKQIMAELSHNTNCDFIVKLYHTFADRNNIYYILEFCSGGDIGQLMASQASGAFSERTMKFYLASIVLGLEAIHANHIVYRDMKPDNVFIDQIGYCKIGDFGISKKTQRTYTFWGTLEYQAPEMIYNIGYSKSIDIWALGIVAFELIYGFTPFMAEERNRTKIILNTVEHKRGDLTKERIEDLVDQFAPTDADYPDMSEECLDLVNQLLAPKPARRLGCGFGDEAGDIKKHPFFNTTDWDKLADKTTPAPWIPEQHDYTVSCDGPKFEPLLPNEQRNALPDVNSILYAETEGN